MLLELKIKNFKSIKNEVNLSVCKLINKGNKNIIFTKNKKHPKILKSILISGPNSSGKSNLIEALYYINYLIVSSNKFELNKKLKYKPFKLDENTINEPSEFEISLLIDNKIYKYGFSLDENKIYKEYLYLTDNSLQKEIFFRNQQEFKFGINLKEQDTLSKRTNENKLYLSVAADWGFEACKTLYSFIAEKLSFISKLRENEILLPKIMINNPEFKTDIVSKLQNVGIKIKDIVIDKNENGNPITKNDFFDYFIKYVEEKEGIDKANSIREKALSEENYDFYSIHEYLDRNNELKFKRFNLFEDESEGTIEFIEKAAAIVHHINAGGILVIDEIESSLHPKLVCFLNEYINGDQNKSAQVIYTTHCYDLLDLKKSKLRHDQIYFTEKNKDQSTSLFTLANFNERKDVSVYKKYFDGSYSLQNLENLQKGDIK